MSYRAIKTRRNHDMISHARDIAIVAWVICQGLSWFFPGSYGMFEAQADAGYYHYTEHAVPWAD